MKIILSDSSGGAYLGVLEELRSNLSGGNHIVLVPDRFTASVEREILRSLEIDATANIEVTSFTRLADRLIGKNIKKCLTPEGSVMLLTKVLHEKADELVYYKNAARTDGVAEELYAALTALRNSGISVESLKNGAEKMPPAMKRKTRDIALIYEGYLAALIERHSDSSTRLEALAEYLSVCEPIADRYYCMDFYAFKAPELDILRSLSYKASALTVGLVGEFENPNKRIYPSAVLRRLTEGSEASVVTYKTLSDPVKKTVSEYLFSCEFPKAVECGGRVKLCRARDRYDEVLYAALEIEKKVRSGARYRDFEILVSDAEEYASDIKSVFSRYGIPFFMDIKAPLAEQTKVRYILRAVSAVKSGFKREEVLAFVKNPLFSYYTEGGADDAFVFENYVLRYNIDYGRFFREFTLTDGKDGLNIAESVRKVLVSKLKPFDIKGTAPIKKFADAARRFSDDAQDAWLDHVEKLTELSAYYKKCAEQVDEKIKSVLDETDATLSGQTDISGFYGIFGNMLKTLKIALVPTYLDCVFVGDTDSRFMDARDVFVLGAAYGKLPKTAAGGTVLTHKDEELFQKLGLEIFPDRSERNYANMLAVCEFMKKMSGTLYVSYPENSAEGAQRPSPVVSELKSFFLSEDKPLEIENVSANRTTEEAEARVFEFSTERAAYHEILRNALSGACTPRERELYSSAYATLSGKSKLKIENAIRIPERLSEKMPEESFTSVSRLERFFVCPYSHFFRYALKLKKRPEGEFEGTENGIILHYVLERFYADIMRGAVDCNNAAARAYSYFDDAIKEYNFSVLLEKPESGRLLMRLKEECAEVCCDLYGIYLRSEFKPALLEAEIGEGFIKPMSIISEGKAVKLRGKIDRVDVCSDEFVIIDYKTYKSADIALKDLYYGEKLQLYVYLAAMLNGGDLKPAGAFYLPIFAGFRKEGENRYKFKGHTVDDEDTLCRIDSLCSTAPDDSVVPFRREKNGNFKRETHVGESGLRALGDYACALAGEGIKGINSGYIKPAPLREACDRCDYSQICAFKNTFVRKTGKVTLESFIARAKEAEDNE